MNNQKDTTAATAQQDAVIASLMSEAKSAGKAIRVMAKCVADTMEEVHGQKFRVDVDHDVGFVLIRPL
jgi:hypothetical protein